MHNTEELDGKWALLARELTANRTGVPHLRRLYADLRLPEREVRVYALWVAEVMLGDTDEVASADVPNQWGETETVYLQAAGVSEATALDALEWLLLDLKRRGIVAQ